MKLFSLEGKTAIVIGGSKGLGRGIATGLSFAGANVVICSRNKDDLNRAANEISKDTGGVVEAVAVDISSVDEINRLVDIVAEMYGHIDILVNSAGVNIRKPAIEYSEADWDIVQNIQLKQVFFTCQAVAKHMISKKIQGKIINIASLTSQLGLPNMISYCCAKGAIVQMTKALANELAIHGINVNAIGPGYYKTEMTKPLLDNNENMERIISRIPMRRTGDPEDLMGTAIFLSAEASDYITGQIIYVDGGWLAC